MPAPRREPFDERIMPTFNRFQARSDERFRIPLLPIASIPATMEMSGLPAERSMNLDSDAVKRVGALHRDRGVVIPAAIGIAGMA
jgi:hypothetical protein